MKLDMEFIRRKRTPLAGYAFLAMASGVAAVAFANWSDLKAQAAQKQEHIAKLESDVRRQQRAASLGPALTPEQELRAAQQLKMMASLRYPWSRVLASIEQHDQKEVAILSFSHSQHGNVTLLSVEGASVAALVAYVDEMNESDNAVHWYLASHQVQVQNTAPTVKGEILMK